jgi:hypothetical protein
MTKQIKLMTEYGAHPLWWHKETAREMNAYNLMPSTLPLRLETLARLRKWAETYDSILRWDDPAASGFATKEEEEAFEQEGIALWEMLREELGDNYHVVYHSQKHHKILENPDEIDMEV